MLPWSSNPMKKKDWLGPTLCWWFPTGAAYFSSTKEPPKPQARSPQPAARLHDLAPGVVLGNSATLRGFWSSGRAIGGTRRKQRPFSGGKPPRGSLETQGDKAVSSTCGRDLDILCRRGCLERMGNWNGRI